MVCAHHRSELLKFGELIAQLPACGQRRQRELMERQPAKGRRQRGEGGDMGVLGAAPCLTSMLLLPQEMQSQPCGGRAATKKGQASATSATRKQSGISPRE